MACLEYPLGMNVCMQLRAEMRGRDGKTEHPTVAIATETSANLCKKMKRGKQPLGM